MPTDLVDAVGARAADRPLVYEMTRLRTVVVPPHTSQDEVALVRRFTVPDGRTFGAGGTARLATDATDPALDAALGIPGADAGGITVTSSQHLPGDIQARGSSAFDGDPATAWSTRLRRARRAVGRRDHPATGDLRPPRPAGRRRRQALRSHAAPHRRGWRVADRRPPGGHRRRGRRGAGVGAGAVRSAHRFRRAHHRHRHTAGRDPRLPRAGAVDDAGRPCRGGTARRAARRHAGHAPGRLPDRSARGRRSAVGRRAPGFDRRRRRGQARRPGGVPGVVGGRGAHARAGRPHGALGAGHTERHRCRRAGAGLRRRGRGDDARRTRRAAPVGHPTAGPARGDAPGAGHEHGQHQDRAGGQRRQSGHAVLAGAGPELECGVGGERRGQGRRRVDAGQRLRERMARAPDGGHVLGDAPVDAAAHGVDRARGVGARLPGLPVPRAASPPGERTKG